MRRSLFVASALLACVGILVASPDVLEAQASGSNADFATGNVGWNGLSGLLDVAREEDATLIVTRRLDIGTLTPSDGLLIVHPLEPLPTEAITAFLQAGGRVALADDFGAADTFLQAFHIDRSAPPTNLPDVLRLRGNPELLVARATSSHPLREGVASIVTNHPRSLFHTELEPIFAIRPLEAVVLAGAVGEGRLVAIGDPSVLINNMLELTGNRRFASNLLLYLRRDASSRIVLVEPGGVIVGRFGEPGADRPLHDVRRFLERVSSADVPPLALRILALSIVTIALILVFGAIPRTSPYDGAAVLESPRVAGGLFGRIAWYGARPTELLEPALVYKGELDAALRARLGLSVAALNERAPADPKELLSAMRSRGCSPRSIEQARRLLEELAALAAASEREPAPSVGEARLRDLVTRGEALLASMPDPSSGERR